LAKAEVERRQASAPDSGRGGASRLIRGAPRTPLRAGHGILRLPAFRFPYFIVIARSEATKQSRTEPLHWIASLTLAMTA